MDWSKVFSKGVLGALTFAVSLGVSYLASHNEVIMKLIPDNIEQMTVGGIVAAIIVAVANWLKHKAE